MLHLSVHKPKVLKTHTVFLLTRSVEPLSWKHSAAALAGSSRGGRGHQLLHPDRRTARVWQQQVLDDMFDLWCQTWTCKQLRRNNVLSFSSQRGQDDQKKKRTSQFCYTGLPRYTALDAVGWVRHLWIDQSEDRSTPAISICFINYSVCVFLQGAAAVLFMQLCRRIHSRFSSHADQNSGPARIRDVRLVGKCTYKVLIDIRESCCQSHARIGQ